MAKHFVSSMILKGYAYKNIEICLDIIKILLEEDHGSLLAFNDGNVVWPFLYPQPWDSFDGWTVL